MDFWIIRWFCGSMQFLLFIVTCFHNRVGKECEGFKVRCQGCKSRVRSLSSEGLGEEVNPLNLNFLLHKAGAPPPTQHTRACTHPAQGPKQQMRPTGLWEIGWGWVILEATEWKGGWVCAGAR